MGRSYISLAGGWYYDYLFILTIHYYCYPHIIYNSLELLFPYYLYIYGDLFEKGKFDIPKLFGMFTIYHFYCFKMQLFKNVCISHFSLSFLVCSIWTKSNDRSKINECHQHTHFFYGRHFCIFYLKRLEHQCSGEFRNL